MVKKSLLTRVGAATLAAAMILASGCTQGTGTTATSTPTPVPTKAVTPEGNTPVKEWDGSYIDADDYKAYIANDLADVANSMMSQVTAAQKTVIEKVVATGTSEIENAQSIAEVQNAYNKAYSNLLEAVPLANGIYAFADKSYSERTEMLGSVEKYAVSTGITGISLYESASFVMYNPRITLGTENYITGYGFGNLAEGSITADLDYETNAAWKRYYHSVLTDDPGTMYYHNDKGSTVGDVYGYIAGGFFTTFMNETKDGYDWIPELAKEKPVAVNDDDGNGIATKWRFEVRTGAKDGLKYTTLSTIPSRAAYNNRPVELEDYITPFKLLLTQSNGLARGSETANATAGAIVGAKEYYKASADGFNKEAWDKVGIKVYEENGKSYFEFEYTTEVNRFYAMYYIASSLYSPIPQSFLDLVTVQNYLGFNKTATETPLDNSLSLGAYTLEKWDQDKQIVFKKNPNYVFADTKYSIQGLHFKVFPAAKSDTMAAMNEFLAGHIDSATVQKEVLDTYRNDPRTRTTKGTSVFKLNANALDSATWEYYFGENGIVSPTAKEDYWECEPAMSNAHFRQGLSYSINRLAYANARGSVGTVNYLAPNYMSDPENGFSYSVTDAHAKAVEALLEGTDGYGYSLELARDYFRMALDELEKTGAYTPGTKENPHVIEIEIAWMEASDKESSHNEIAQYLMEAFNDDSVCGGKYKLDVTFWVGNVWSDVYYNKLMLGRFDLGFGSISGNALNPLDYMSVLSANQDISGGFTLNWGTDTNDPAAYPLVYNGERYSFDGLLMAANSTAILADGENREAYSGNQTALVKNADGSYTGSYTFTCTLPDKTKIDILDVVCCNYERYRNGDGQYAESSVAFTVEDKGNGIIVVTYTVPADLAADYKTGSGTSENPKGITGFDIYYDMTLGGSVSAGQYTSIEDIFN